MADVKPLFSSLDVSILQQGLQKIINECDEHRDTLFKGQHSVDDTVHAIGEQYNQRKAQCHQALRKLPILLDLPPINSLQL